jgi:glycosyltransferase involved in cell wall biosynthesis
MPQALGGSLSLRQLPTYAVLVRTFNSSATLPATLRSIAAQTALPSQYVFVDSGSTDSTEALLPAGGRLHRYQGSQFNYADALNQGIECITADYVLIISSHTTLNRADAIERTLGLLCSRDDVGAAYFLENKAEDLTCELIGKSTFDGFNGLWNTCALIKVDLLRRRPFRREVFASEDQEWARWLIHEEGKLTARIGGADMAIHNPRRWNYRKRINEYVAVAYYSNRALLRPRHLVHMVGKALSLDGTLRAGARFVLLAAAWRLMLCRFRRPIGQSRYF